MIIMWPRKLLLTIHLCASLLLIRKCTSTTRLGYHQKDHGVLKFNLKTIFDGGGKNQTTWMIKLNSSLLDFPTPAYFLGVVPTHAVVTVCNMTNKGKYIIPTLITMQGQVQQHTLKVRSVIGCDTLSSIPKGVQSVLSYEDNIEDFLICHEKHAHTVGCALYRMGNDKANIIYHTMESLYSTHFPDRFGVSHSTNNQQLVSVDSRRLLEIPKCVKDGVYAGYFAGIGAFVYNVKLIIAECGLVVPEFFPMCVTVNGLAMLGSTIPVFVLLSCITAAIQSCFPGDGLVTLPTWLQKPMMELSIGDKVAVMRPDGHIAFDEIYAFGHNNPNAMSDFVKLTLKPTLMADAGYLVKTLELSPHHFVPISLASNGNMMYKRAKDIQMGNLLWVNINHSNTLDQFVVTDSVVIVKEGLYNPFTLTGNILVGNVVASTHSDWFLDDLFDTIKITHWLPMVYQMLLFPARMLYRMLGKKAYTQLYVFLDAHIDLSATFGTHHARKIVATIAILFGISLPSFSFLKRCSKLHH